MNKKKINIGFDIGVTSVGWSLIDEDYKIVDMGVRLFNDPANPKDGTLKNDKRRSSRTNRRRIRRVRTRKDAFANFLVQQNWIKSTDELADLINVDITEFGVDNPIELKVKAMEQTITREQLIFVLFHYIHHRGFFYITQEMLDKVDINETEIKYPSREMFEFYKTNGYYKGAEQNQSFSARDYIKEITKVLETQEISKDFIDGYINIFSQVRDFATGPGSKKSPTPYGLWFINNEGKLESKGENLWDATIGKCTYYPTENRGLKNSPMAEVFNLYNDLNNIYLYNDKSLHLSKDVKKALFKEMNEGIVKGKKKNINLKLIVKCIKEYSGGNEELLDIKEENICGYRVEGKDDKKKALFTELKNYSIIAKWLLQEGKVESKSLDLFDSTNIKLANEVFSLIASSRDSIKQLNSLNEKYKVKDIEGAVKLLKNLDGVTKTHSLSYKAMLEFIDYCIDHIDESINQMQYFTNKGIVNNSTMKPSKYFKTGLYNDEIISPTARRAFNQNIKVMNKIIKFYSDEYDIENITFELARDKNSKEERKSIEDSQKRNKEEIDTISKDYDIDASKLNSAARLRLKLWKDQGGIDIYDGEDIKIADVLSGKGLQVDHIIPYSISAMDSRANKVITKSYNNSDKLDSTPYQWLSKNGKFEAFQDRVEKYITNPKKKEYLLYKLDPLNNMEGFIERNIVDTRYASRVILNTFQEFFRVNKDRYPNAKIKVINGSITNFARYNLLTDADNHVILKKDRDLYCHHAIDASIVCYLGMNDSIAKMTKWFNSSTKESNKLKKDDNNRLYNDETGEYIDITKWSDKSKQVKEFAEQLALYNDEYDRETEQIISNHKVKFSRQLEQKNNIQLSNETIYSFKWKNETEGNMVTKLNLLSEPNATLNKYFKDGQIVEKELETLFVYTWDKPFYMKLKSIYNNFYNEKVNPFVEYMKSEHNIEKPLFIIVDKQRVKSLRVLDSSKSIDNIIVLKKHNGNAIMESLNAIKIRVHKDNKEKLVTIPVNQKFLQFNSKSNKLCINEDVYNKFIATKCFSENFIEITSGTIFIHKENNNLLYSNGGGNFSANKLELKSLSSSNEKCGYPKQWQCAISTIAQNFDIAEVDELGNIYNRRKIEL